MVALDSGLSDVGRVLVEVVLLDNGRYFMLCNVRQVSAFVPGTPFRMFLIHSRLGVRD